MRFVVAERVGAKRFGKLLFVFSGPLLRPIARPPVHRDVGLAIERQVVLEHVGEGGVMEQTVQVD